MNALVSLLVSVCPAAGLDNVNTSLVVLPGWTRRLEAGLARGPTALGEEGLAELFRVAGIPEAYIPPSNEGTYKLELCAGTRQRDEQARQRTRRQRLSQNMGLLRRRLKATRESAFGPRLAAGAVAPPPPRSLLPRSTPAPVPHRGVLGALGAPTSIEQAGQSSPSPPPVPAAPANCPTPAPVAPSDQPPPSAHPLPAAAAAPATAASSSGVPPTPSPTQPPCPTPATAPAPPATTSPPPSSESSQLPPNPFASSSAEEQAAAWAELLHLRSLQAKATGEESGESSAGSNVMDESPSIAIAPPPKRRRSVAAQTAKEEKQAVMISKLRAQKAAMVEERKLLRRKLKHLKVSAGDDKRRLVALSNESSRKLVKLLAGNASELPPKMIYLKELIANQLSVLDNKSGTCMWHPAVLEACSAIYSCNPAAYAEMVQSGLLALPSPGHIKKLVASAVTDSTGHDLSRYKDLGKEVEEWPDKMREVCLMYDEVNLVGQLAFKKVGGKFCFFGIVDDPDNNSVFVDPKKGQLSPEERILGMKAKAALVMQVVFIHNVGAYGEGLTQEPIFRRVVGVHAVNSPAAEKVEKLVSESIAYLEMVGVSVIATSSDGASCFRLQQKYSTSGEGRGTANIFVTTTRSNDANLGRIINMLSDISHLLKKACTNLYKSDPHSKSRFMKLPDYLVQMVFATRPFPGDADGTKEKGETVGLEAYIYVWGRIWELLGAADQPPWRTADPALDSRVQELLDLLEWMDMWDDYNMKASALAGLKPDIRRMRGLPHETRYDTRACLRGFLNVLKDLEDRHDEFSVLARRFCTDCLESLFGQMRQAGGGQRDLQIKRVVELARKIEAKTKRKAIRIKSREARTNSGLATGDEDAAVAPRVQMKKKAKRRGLFGNTSFDKKMAQRANTRRALHNSTCSYVPPQWMKDHEFKLPADAKAQHDQAKASGVLADHEVCWCALRRVQEVDEKRLRQGHKKRMKWLSTAKHINRTSYSQLSVDVAMAVLCLPTADQLRLKRRGFWA